MVSRNDQEKALAYRILESRAEALLQQREAIMNKANEIEATLKSMEDLQKSMSTVLFPIGGEAYTFGKVSDAKKYLVEIGAGVALEKTAEEAKNILEKRKVELHKGISQIEKELEKISKEIYDMMPSG